MNKRIRELQFQAAAQVNPLLEGSEWQQVFVENFAELIIKETLQVARAGIEFGDGMEDAVYKYFGVEE